MKIGDLVRYAGGNNPSWTGGIGIVLEINNLACLVRWVNGTESNHSVKWLIKVETSENT